MQAESGKKYALINDFKVVEIFDSSTLSQWDENSILAIPLSAEQEAWVKVGCSYDGENILQKTLEEHKQEKLDYVNFCFEQECSAVKGEYIPNDELLTWNLQEAEAKAFSANAQAATPLLSTLAKARGLELGALCSKVLEKSTLYSQAVALLVGNRQALQDKIEAATTQKELDAIKYVSPLPSQAKA